MEIQYLQIQTTAYVFDPVTIQEKGTGKTVGSINCYPGPDGERVFHVKDIRNPEVVVHFSPIESLNAAKALAEFHFQTAAP